MDFPFTKEGQAFMYVVNSFQMALRLPFMMNPFDEYERFFAMLESWSINMRLSLEFFNIVNSSRKNEDFNCLSLFGYNKTLNKRDKQKLIDLKNTVDKFVIHFSNQRIDNNNNTKIDEITISDMQEYASILVKEIVPFLKYIKETHKIDFDANYVYIEKMLKPYGEAIS